MATQYFYPPIIFMFLLNCCNYGQTDRLAAFSKTRNSTLLLPYLNFQKYGCSIWRNDDAMNAAEKKLILIACFAVGVSTILGSYYTFLSSRNNELQVALTSYFLCELPGYVMENENDIITCSKDEIVKYSYTGLSIASVFIYALSPLVFLLVIIEWRSSIQKMNELLHMKNKNNELSASNLAQLNRSNEVSNTLILGNYTADAK